MGCGASSTARVGIEPLGAGPGTPHNTDQEAGEQHRRAAENATDARVQAGSGPGTDGPAMLGDGRLECNVISGGKDSTLVNLRHGDGDSSIAPSGPASGSKSKHTRSRPITLGFGGGLLEKNNKSHVDASQERAHTILSTAADHRLPRGGTLPPITLPQGQNTSNKKKKKKKIVVTTKVRKKTPPKTDIPGRKTNAPPATLSQVYTVGGQSKVTEQMTEAPVAGGEGSGKNSSVISSNNTEGHRLPNMPIVYRRRKRQGDSEAELSSSSTSNFSVPREDTEKDVAKLGAETCETVAGGEQDAPAETDTPDEKPTFPPPELCQLGSPTYGVTLSLNHARFNSGLAGLEERWGEARFLLRKQIRSEDDLDQIHRTVYQSILLLHEIENLSRALGCLQGTLSRWLMPFDVNTSVADQVVQVGSGNPNDSNGTFAGISDEKRSELTFKMLALRSTIRIKVADDNDLAQALNALQDIDAFFRLLAQEAESSNHGRFELLETL